MYHKTVLFVLMYCDRAFQRFGCIQVDLPNPPHIDQQHLRGISDEMNPTALNRPASFVEEKIGTLIKTFQRTISDEVGNAGPEHCRTKKALVLSMRTIQSLLR